jgi:tetratricopeptide (TPR) repeat protein
MKKKNRISIREKISLIIFGVFLCFILLEIGLRLGGFILLFLQEYKNNVAIQKKGTYRIMCLGESTTAGGTDSYPSQLEEILNQRNTGIKFSVINKGVSGTTSFCILSNLEDNLSKYKPDMIITMMGINEEYGEFMYGNLYKIPFFLKNLRICKFTKLLYLHITDKMRQIGIYKIQQKHTDIRPITKRLLESKDIKKGQLYFGLGLKYEHKRQYNKAKRKYSEIIKIDPANYRAYFGLGTCYQYLGEYDKAEEMFKKAIDITSGNEGAYRCLALFYRETGRYHDAEKYFRKADKIGLELYFPTIQQNFQALQRILMQEKIKFVCVQYPLRNVEPLKNMFGAADGVIFVDNEEIFKKALKTSNYKEYFIDNFGGDFGHCTRKGNRLLAENIANVILKQYFDR